MEAVYLCLFWHKYDCWDHTEDTDHTVRQQKVDNVAGEL